MLRLSQRVKQQAGLRLDTAASIRTGGDSGPAITPGKPVESLLVKRLSALDAETRMPPESEGERLDSRQLQIVQAWIEQGAKAPDEPLPPDPRNHWAYHSPVRPVVPMVQHAAWIRNPIDAFIAANHDLLHLLPAGEAAKNVLLRRVYLDLIGLPPTPTSCTRSWPTIRRTLTSASWMSCCASPHMASAGAATGWTSGATATGPDLRRRSARASGTFGGGAIGSSNR